MVEAAPILGKYTLLGRRGATMHPGAETWDARALDGTERLVFAFGGATALPARGFVFARSLAGLAGVVPVVDAGYDDAQKFVVVSEALGGTSLAETLAKLRWLDEEMACDVVLAVAHVLDRLRMTRDCIYLPRLAAISIVAPREVLIVAPLRAPTSRDDLPEGDEVPTPADLVRWLATFAFELLVGRPPRDPLALPSDARRTLPDVPELPTWFDGWWTHASRVGGFANVAALVDGWGHALPVLAAPRSEPLPFIPHPPGGMMPIRPPLEMPGPPPPIHPPFRVGPSVGGPPPPLDLPPDPPGFPPVPAPRRPSPVPPPLVPRKTS